LIKQAPPLGQAFKYWRTQGRSVSAGSIPSVTGMLGLEDICRSTRPIHKLSERRHQGISVNTKAGRALYAGLSGE